MQNPVFPQYTSEPVQIENGHKLIHVFSSSGIQNADLSVIKSFGDEWKKFHQFGNEDINRLAAEYFDIIPDSKMLEVGCGSGRWTRVLSPKVGIVDAVDPSDAIYAADELLKDFSNVRLTKAASENLPFEDNTYDLVISIGVLHHIPDTLKAMKDCVSKVKPGGYFYTYLYYKLENRGLLFRAFFFVSNLLRKVVSALPGSIKKIVCDVLAVVVYMPFVLLSRLFYKAGFKKLADKIPLSTYKDKSFFIIRNDALDRFGTKLEQRFTRQQIQEMMIACGLVNIKFSEKMPFWHAIGQK